jgi:outer membrane protein assembly factor BamB
MQETVLTTANVNSVQFGKLFTRAVDAPFYASPLIVTNFNVPGVGVRDVVYVATLGNSVYAFDADNPNDSAPYWSVTLGAPLQTGCCFLGPTLGILSTPVIDRSTNTIYVTAVIQSSDVGLYVFALDLGTGP